MPIHVDPLKPHFYIVKLGFTGVYINFLIFAQNIDCGHSSTNNLCFEQKHKKYQIFYLKIFIFLMVKFSMYLNRRVFVMFPKDRLYHFMQIEETICMKHQSLFSGKNMKTFSKCRLLTSFYPACRTLNCV